MVTGGIRVAMVVSPGIRVTKAIASVFYLIVTAEDIKMLTCSCSDLARAKLEGAYLVQANLE
jgi:hypothetical protein